MAEVAGPGPVLNLRSTSKPGLDLSPVFSPFGVPVASWYGEVRGGDCLRILRQSSLSLSPFPWHNKARRLKRMYTGDG
jgi:hypothetical protein